MQPKQLHTIPVHIVLCSLLGNSLDRESEIHLSFVISTALKARNIQSTRAGYVRLPIVARLRRVSAVLVQPCVVFAIHCVMSTRPRCLAVEQSTFVQFLRTLVEPRRYDATVPTERTKSPASFFRALTRSPETTVD